MAARMFQRVPEHLLNARFNHTSDALSVILIVNPITEATLTGTSAQSLAESQWISEWSAYTPTVTGNAISVGANMVRSGLVFKVVGDATQATLPYPGVATGYGVIIFKNTGVTTSSPVFIIDVFTTPVALSAVDTFVYQLPTDGMFDFITGVV